MVSSNALAAEHLSVCKNDLLTRWRGLVRADARLPDGRLSFTNDQLDDHLPALLESIANCLHGEQVVEAGIHEAGVRHGTTRRAQGYSVTQLIWEFSIFRKLLRETIEQLRDRLPPEGLFQAREVVLKLTDQSELGSVEQYVDEARQERDDAREQVRKADEQKDRFLAVLSHELRNPLASIRTATHIIQGGHPSPSERQRALEIIDRQTRYQARLIDDLLDINRISQGRIELKPENMDLRQAVQNVIEAYQTAIQSKSISFRFDAPGHEIAIFGDSVRIEQIVSNLLANSLKFTKSGGSIEIVLRQEDSDAILSVRDSGAGIDPSKLTTVFDIFSQAQAGKSEDGLGIGLWLAKQLVGMHGGVIQAKSAGLEKGTEITVKLPCLVRASSSRAIKQVLLVEDDPDQRELLAIALRDIDADIVGAKDGSEAVAACRGRAFDVCILDLNLPDISGYDLAAHLIDLHVECRPVMVALTGAGRPEDRARVKAAGFDHHLVKPPELDQLQRIITQSGNRAIE